MPNSNFSLNHEAAAQLNLSHQLSDQRQSTQNHNIIIHRIHIHIPIRIHHTLHIIEPIHTHIHHQTSTTKVSHSENKSQPAARYNR